MRRALERAELVMGYRTYLDLVEPLLGPGQERRASSMMKEVERCREALEYAASGRSVVLVCSGDPGIYAMAGLVFELAAGMESPPPIEVVPGIAALNACAALLGAPLMHDFCAISLSDLLTPWPVIEKRLAAAAAADFVIVLYNPRSRRRTWQIETARDIILAERSPATPVGIVTAASRPAESVTLTTLAQMLDHDIAMQTTVIVGNSATRIVEGRMVTPRGYGGKYAL